jgi:II/X family phage/plasmid replication protein
MIISIRITGYYEIDEGYLDHCKWTNEYSSSRNEYDNIRYVYRQKGDTIKIEYSFSSRYITIELSIPKFMHGNNVTIVDDTGISLFYDKLLKYLKKNYPCTAHHDIKTWKVQRMDVCYNFQVGVLVKDYINAFSNINISRYKTCCYGNNESVVIFNSSKRMIFYDKETEVRHSKGNNDLIELSKGILRFEANIKGIDLSNFSRHRFAGELLNLKAAKHLILKHLEKLNLNKHLSYNTMYEISKQLSDAYPPNKVQELLGFILYTL